MGLEVDASFGAWISRRRQILDLTQADLARRVGYSLSAVRKIEGDMRRPSAQVAELLADHLQILPDQRETFLKVARGEWRVDRLSPANVSAPIGQPAPLPVPATPLFGREPELEAILRLLRDPQCRLLTLVGPGGMGKTRLAIEAATREGQHYDGGAAFASLASVNSSAFIVGTVADAAGIPLDGTHDAKEQLLTQLRDRHMLLVVDNLEHLLEGSLLFSDILTRAPEVKVLATSRERLKLQGEWVFEVQGLPTPPTGQTDDLHVYSAVGLFVATARRIRADWKPTPADEDAIAHICRMVDGMPLGIEMAAGWVRVLSCEEIAQEISRNLDFLTATTRDLPARHRSLRAVFDRSWQLLADEERRSLRALSIFRGGFTREMAEQVAGTRLGMLGALTERSLLVRDSGGRFDLHEVVRQFALRRLAEAGEAEAVARRHAQLLLALAQKMNLLEENPAAQALRRRLDAEQNNLRAALEWAAGSPNAEAHLIGLRLATALSRFWYLQGQWIEARDWLSRMAALPGARDCPERARTITELGIHLTALCDYTEARAHLIEALALSRAAGDGWNEAWTLYSHAQLSGMHLDFIGAAQMTSQALEIFNRLGDRWGMAVSLTRLAGMLCRTHEYDKAERYIQESVSLHEALQDEGGLASALLTWGSLAYYTANYKLSEELLDKGLMLHSRIGNREGMKWGYRSKGVVALFQGQYALALENDRKALALSWELRARTSIADVFTEMSHAEVGLQHYRRATRLFAAAFALSRALNTPVSAERYEMLTAPMCAGLGEEAFRSEWEAGMAMSLEQAVTFGFEALEGAAQEGDRE